MQLLGEAAGFLLLIVLQNCFSINYSIFLLYIVVERLKVLIIDSLSKFAQEVFNVCCIS